MRTKEQRDEQVAQYLHLDFSLFWPIVLFGDALKETRTKGFIRCYYNVVVVVVAVVVISVVVVIKICILFTLRFLSFDIGTDRTPYLDAKSQLKK